MRAAVVVIAALLFSQLGGAQVPVCNVTQDQTASVADVHWLIKEALGTASATDDLNGDSVVNIADVQIVINAANSLGCSVVSLTAITPASGAAGQSPTVAIRSVGTNFAQGLTQASFGPGISVGGATEGQPGPVTVVSPTIVAARLIIDPAATTGMRNITVTTGNQALSSTNAFSVLAGLPAYGPLSVVSTLPAAGATAVSQSPTIQVAFNEPLDASTVTPTTFSLTNGTSVLPASLSYNSTTNTVTMTPSGALRPQVVYTVTVASQLKNVAENQLGAPFAFTFTTQPPTTVTGAVTTPAGLTPTTLSVVSYGGNSTTPDASGTFTATLNPQGTDLVAAMIPGKPFGLLAMTIGGMPSTVASSNTNQKSSVPFGPSGTASERRTYRTKWQVTSSATAATAGSGIVADFQTTAETLVFLSPYLFTSNPQQAPTIFSAIAANAATAQFAAVLAQDWSEANPLGDPAVQSAYQNAVQAVVQALVPQSPATALPRQAVAPELRGTQALPRTPGGGSTATTPATVATTPYCWSDPDHAATENGLQCLDLDYLSLPSGSVTANSDGSYTFSPLSCTGSSGNGCTVGWLARVTPLPSSSDSGNPGTIVAVGPDTFGPESPVGSPPGTYDSAACGVAGPCYVGWVDSGSSPADLQSGFLQAVSSVAQGLGFGTPSAAAGFSLPGQTQQAASYIARFYSGGVADSGELNNIKDSGYTNGVALFSEALVLNAMEAAFNYIDAVGVLPDTVTSCALAGTASQLVAQGTVDATNDTTQATIEGKFEDVFNLAMGQVSSCYQQSGLGNVQQMLGDVYTWGSGAGTVLVSGAADLGQASQQIAELFSAASALETSVIVIAPGSSLPGNPVPSISSLSPSSSVAGSSSQTLTIYGNGFLSGSTVTFNGTAHLAALVSSGQITITLTAADQATAGGYPVVVTNPSPGGGSSSSVSFTVELGTPTFAASSVVNAASLLSGPIAPNEAVDIFGTNIGPAVLISASSNPLPVTLGGYSVLVNGQAAALYYVSATQVSFVVPASLSGSSATLQVTGQVNGQTVQSAIVAVAVVVTAPGLYTAAQTGTGIGEFLSSTTFAAITPTNPAQPGQILVVYGTGFRGATSPVTLTVGGQSAAIYYQGAGGQYPGLDQINFEVPGTAEAGNLSVVVTAGGQTSNTVLLPVANH